MLKPNQIYCGDCLEVMKDIRDESIDLIVTDPPYLINYRTNRRQDKDHEFCTVIQNDDNPEVVAESIYQCFRVLKPDTACYMFCGPDKVDWFKLELEKHFTIKNMIIWVKNNHTAGDLEAQFGKQYEVLFLVNKGRAKFYGKRLTDVWFFNRKTGSRQFHQNQKPVNLIEQCIRKHSKKGDLVLDPFAGSGTTAQACINTHRQYICIEKEQKYVETIKRRIKTAEPQLF